MLGFCEINSLRRQRCKSLRKSHIGDGRTVGKKGLSSEFLTPRIPTTSRRTIIATIIERPRKNKPSNWQAIVRVGNQSKSKTFDTHQDAVSFASALESQLCKQREKTVRAEQKARLKQPTLFDYTNENLRRTLILFRDSSDCIDRHRRIIPTLLKHVGEIKIGEITTRWTKEYTSRLLRAKTRIKTTFTHSSIACHLNTVSAACRWRAEQMELPPQPSFCSTRHFPKNWETRRTRRLSVDEQAKLEKVLLEVRNDSAQHWISLVHLALETGARLQEVLGAQYDEVQMDSRIWTIPAARTKSKKERVVPLTKEAIMHFSLLEKDRIPSSNRFLNRLGDPLSVSAGFHKYVIRAGLADFKFHDLRHESISRMVLYKRKLSIFEIMAIVGHSDTRMLMRYANLRGEELVERMD